MIPLFNAHKEVHAGLKKAGMDTPVSLPLASKCRRLTLLPVLKAMGGFGYPHYLFVPLEPGLTL